MIVDRSGRERRKRKRRRGSARDELLLGAGRTRLRLETMPMVHMGMAASQPAVSVVELSRDQVQRNILLVVGNDEEYIQAWQEVTVPMHRTLGQDD